MMVLGSIKVEMDCHLIQGVTLTKMKHLLKTDE